MESDFSKIMAIQLVLDFFLASSKCSYFLRIQNREVKLICQVSGRKVMRAQTLEQSESSPCD